MLKTFSTITGTGTYVSPAIDVSHVKTKRVICTSPYGDNGLAGGSFTDTNTNDYSSDDNLL